MRRVPRSWWSLVLTLGLASTVLLLSPVLSHHLFPPDAAAPPLHQPDHLPPHRPQDLISVPLAFVETQDPRDAAVHFQAHGLRGTSLAFTPAEVVISLPLTATHAPQARPARLQPARTQRSQSPPLSTTSVLTHTHLRMQFVGARRDPQIRGAERLPGVVHTFLGNDPTQWRTALPTYQGIRYEELYDGIDLRYDGTQEHLKGTYIVAPRADPTQIRWRYAGAEHVTLDTPSGDLIITPQLPPDARTTPLTLTERAPIAWQVWDGVRAAVPVHYVVAPDDTIRLEVGAYDPSLPLIIDPILEYSLFLGGSRGGDAIAVDSGGNVYVTGAYAAGVVVTKLTAAGTVVYSTYLGGSGGEGGTGIAVDATSSVYLVGTTSSPDFPLHHAFQSTYGGGIDAFVAHLDATGQLAYSTYLGGSAAEMGTGIAVATPQRVVVTGMTESTDFVTTTLAYQPVLRGSQDAFVTALDPTAAPPAATLLYSTYLGGSYQDWGAGIAVDTQTPAHVYLTGETGSDDFPVTDASSSYGMEDAFITRLDITQPGSSALVYSTYLGGAEDDVGRAIAVDAYDHAYLLGETSSEDFPVTSNAVKESAAPGEILNDVFVMRLDTSIPDDPIVYSTFLGGRRWEGAWPGGIAIDGTDHVYVTGVTMSSDFPITSDGLGYVNGEFEAFVTMLDTQIMDDSLVYSSYLAGSGPQDWGHDLAVDASGAIYVTGSTTSADFPGADPATYSGNGDMFLTRIAPGDDPCALPYPPPGSVCPTATPHPTTALYPPPEPTATPGLPSGVIYVDAAASGAASGASWADAYPSLQAGLAVAQSGDELWIAAGTYTPHPSDRTVSFVLPEGVAVYGGFAGTEPHRDERDWTTHVTTLSGEIGTPGDPSDNSYHVVRATNKNASTILDGVTITGGNADNTSQSPHDRGGGLYLSQGSPTLAHLTITANQAVHGGGLYTYQSSPTLTDVTITANTATDKGGGMRAYESSQPVLQQVTFIANQASSMGGGMANFRSHPTLTDVTFQENTATEDGGGMANQQSSPTLTDVTFQENTATHGGGMHNNQSSPTLTDGTFTANTATDKGGGLRNYESPHLTLKYVLFQDNQASHGGGGMSSANSGAELVHAIFQGNSTPSNGGGLLNETSTLTITNALFRTNHASYGGAVYNSGSTLVLTNATMSGNTATNNGGGMRNYATSHATIQNSILWGNTAAGGTVGVQQLANSGSTAMVAFSLIGGSGGSGAWESSLGTDGGHNRDADPLFVNPPDAGADGIWGTADDVLGDLRLRYTSPAVDAGNIDLVPVSMARDLNGYQRIRNDLIDMGAYEYSPDAARRITGTALGAPVAAGDYLFWVDARAQQAAIYGYDLLQQEEFLVKDLEDTTDATALTTDGTTLVWVDHTVAVSPYVRIQGYDIQTQQEFPIIQPTGTGFYYGLDLVDGMLYYADSRAGHVGIYRHDLAGGTEIKLSDSGFYPVVADGVLLWQIVDPQPLPLPEQVHLWMRPADGSGQPTHLGVDTGGLSGYGVSDHHIIWSYSSAAAEQRLQLYDTTTAVSRTMRLGTAHSPVIGNDRIAWVRRPPDGAADPHTWSIQSYDVNKEVYVTIVPTSTAALRTHAILDKHGLLFSVDRDTVYGLQSVYVVDLNGQFESLPDPRQERTKAFTRTRCHAVGDAFAEVAADDQLVRAVGQNLYTRSENGLGCFIMKGVHFFVPRIDGKQDVSDVQFGGPYKEGAYGSWQGVRDLWVGLAKNELHTNTLRIFVGMPGEENPADIGNIYDFVEYVWNQHHMRIGLVLHNSNAFSMNDEKANYIRDVIGCLEGNRTDIEGCGSENILEGVAYFSADNELNVHFKPEGQSDEYNCRDDTHTPPIDCFQQRDDYAKDAVEWVAKFVKVVEHKNPDILVTVGMSTGTVNDVQDGLIGVRNFFKEFEIDDGDGPRVTSLSAEVDFLSPHTYHADHVWLIMDIMNENGYQKPVVLEEYGAATDPAPRYGESEAAEDVKEMLGHVYERGYAGSSAFMLADMLGKECDVDDFHYYTGLFAAMPASEYCGGTLSFITDKEYKLKETGKEVQKTYSNTERDVCGEHVKYLPIVEKNYPPCHPVDPDPEPPPELNLVVCHDDAPKPATKNCTNIGDDDCLPNPFRGYWNENGEWYVFGFPITEVRREYIYNDSCVKYGEDKFEVIWLERDRLEKHGEMVEDVTAGRLGAERLRIEGTDWHDGAKAENPGDSRCIYPTDLELLSQCDRQCIYFSKTEQKVCNKFKDVWFGTNMTDKEALEEKIKESLNRYGLPLTDANERTILRPGEEDWTGTSQYFERRRMEDHGGQGVLFGRLGAELLALYEQWSSDQPD